MRNAGEGRLDEGKGKTGPALIRRCTNACARDQGGLEKKVERALEEVLCNNGGWIFCKSGGISVVVENGNEVIRRFDGLVVKWCEDNCFVELGFWKM